MQQRDYGIDLLRICAAFMVVLLHVAAEQWTVLPYDSADWFVCHFYNSCVRSAVPLFVMISGMFLLNPNKPLTWRMLWQKYCKKILVIFVVWSAAYACAYYAVWPMLQGKPIAWEKVWYEFWEGNYHLWYCKMLLGLYLLMPFLKKITADKALTEYFLVLCAIFTVIVPVLPFEAVHGFMKDTFFYFTLGFTGYFVLGYYLQTVSLSKTVRAMLYVAGIVGWLFTVWGSVSKSYAIGLPFGYFDPQLPNVVCMTIAIFVFFQYHAKALANRFYKVVSGLSGCTLGIYLVHPLVMVVLGKLDFGVTMCSPVVSVPLCAIVIFVLSMCITWCVKRLPIVKHLV